MSYQLISRHEIEDLCEKALKAKWSALMFDLVRTQNLFAERTLALASVETVSVELHLKRGKIREVTAELLAIGAAVPENGAALLGAASFSLWAPYDRGFRGGADACLSQLCA